MVPQKFNGIFSERYIFQLSESHHPLFILYGINKKPNGEVFRSNRLRYVNTIPSG